MKKNKIALITGISGQDGCYLARELVRNSYTVYGSSRSSLRSSEYGLNFLGCLEKVERIYMNPLDLSNVISILNKIKPTHIFHLSSPSSVGLSFQQPLSSISEISNGVLNILEAIRILGRDIRLYHASSSECFGDQSLPIDEQTSFRPASPYAVGKCAASNAVSLYREAYNIFSVNGYLFNHESPLRGENFVTRKVVKTASMIAAGKINKLTLGNLNVVRDWGWAEEYVVAMRLMLESQSPRDYIIGTGKSYSLKNFVECVLDYFDLNFDRCVRIDKSLYRPSEIKANFANPSQASKELGWQAELAMPDVVRLMCDHEKSLKFDV